MGMPENHRHWRNLLIKKDVQLKIAFTNILHIALITLLSISVVLSPLIYDIFYSADVETQYHAARSFVSLIGWLLPALGLTLVLVFIHQLIITHQVCGPLINFTHTFSAIAQGDLTRRIQLRKNDFLKAEALHVNGMMDRLVQVVGELRKDNAGLLAQLDELTSRVGSEAHKPELDQVLSRTREQLRLLNRHLEHLIIEKEKV